MNTYHKATYTIPEELLRELNTFVEQRQRSRFVAEAIRMALEIEKKKLDDAYKAATADNERMHEIEDWSVTEVENWDG